MKIKVGTIIRLNYNINNFPEIDGLNIKHSYYRMCDGEFRIVREDVDFVSTFNGKHFVCLGSDYFHGSKGIIRGFEMLNDDYTIVEDVPKNLIK